MFSSPSVFKVFLHVFLTGLIFVIHGSSAASLTLAPGYFGLGHVPDAREIAGWDIDIRPDGKGLPPGTGSVETGEVIYEEKCSLCHGSFGEGVDGFPVLAGGEDSLTDMRPEKTVGSYWRYTSTLWDYINRTMPFTEPESLGADEVYALVAYVLYLNDLVEDDFTLTQQNLTEVRLPNELNFVPDPRPDVANERCMQDCKKGREITIASSVEPAVIEKVVPNVAAANPAVGQQIYDRYCALCHKTGLGGAPVVGNRDDWTDRLSAGTLALTKNAIDGFTGSSGMMPPKGGFVNLTEIEVGNAVEYMISGSR